MSEEMSLPEARTTTLDRLALDAPNWRNPRTITGLDAKSLDDLGESLLERGQIHALTVVRVFGDTTTVVDEETGEIVTQGDRPIIELVLDGQRRYLAWAKAAKERKKGLSSIAVRVEDLYPEPIELTEETAQKLLMDMVDAAMKREGLSSFEQLEFAMRFKDEGNKKTFEEIAHILRRSPTWVGRMMRAYRLSSPLLLKAFRDGKVTDELFKDLSEINPHDRQEEALGEALGVRAKGGREGKAEVRHAVKAKAAEAKEERAKAEPKKAAKKGKETAKEAKAKPARPPVQRSDKPMTVELVSLRTIVAPSDPYVRGLMDGAAYSLGRMAPEKFAPAWRTYVKKAAKKDVMVPEQLGGMTITDVKKSGKRARK